MATADHQWLDRANAAALYIESTFVNPIPNSPLPTSAGIMTAVQQAPGLTLSAPDVDENVAVVRFGRSLHEYTGIQSHEKLAEHAMQYLAVPEITASRGWEVGGLLLANSQLSSQAPHLVVVGPKRDPMALALYQQLTRWANIPKRIEWIDPSEGRFMLSQNDVQYPQLVKSAVFICTAHSCSAPITDPANLSERLAKIQKSTPSGGKER
jgi:uncharacterized protein